MFKEQDADDRILQRFTLLTGELKIDSAESEYVLLNTLRNT